MVAAATLRGPRAAPGGRPGCRALLASATIVSAATLRAPTAAPGGRPGCRALLVAGTIVSVVTSRRRQPSRATARQVREFGDRASRSLHRGTLGMHDGSARAANDVVCPTTLSERRRVAPTFNMSATRFALSGSMGACDLMFWPFRDGTPHGSLARTRHCSVRDHCDLHATRVVGGPSRNAAGLWEPETSSWDHDEPARHAALW
jgi:hypothetical protein